MSTLYICHTSYIALITPYLPYIFPSLTPHTDILTYLTIQTHDHTDTHIDRV